MQYSVLQFLAVTLAASQVSSAETIKVEVGQGGLTFKPDNIKAAEGDTVEFHFDSMHSVNAGPFDKPCSPLSEGGFGSGPLPDGDNSFFSVKVTNASQPIWFYCGVPGHCQAGMVGVINEPATKKLSTYAKAAASVDQTTNPPKPFGGVISSKSGAGSSPSGSATTGGSSSGTATQSGTAAATTTASKGYAERLSGSAVGAFALSVAIAGLLSA